MSERVNGSLEKNIKCTQCPWQGRETVEKIEPQSIEQNFAFLVGKGIDTPKRCPECGADTVPLTKEMVS